MDKTSAPKKSYTWIRRKYYPDESNGRFSTWTKSKNGERRLLKLKNIAQTVMERHIKVKAQATPYHPDWVEYFEKRKVFAWRSYPVGNNSPLASLGV